MPKPHIVRFPEKNNPALGQCYPTSRVVQYYFPKTEIIEGRVWNGKLLEKHVWNVISVEGTLYHIDLTWQQFPPGSKLFEYKIRDRNALNDSQVTIERCNVLFGRIQSYLLSVNNAKKSKLDIIK